MPLLDIPAVIASKAPKAAKYIPGFIYSYLKRILHQDGLNEILSDGWNLSPQQFVQATFKRWKITYTIEGLEKLDPNGRYIFAANHPFGGMDGMMIADCLIEHFGDARVVVNDMLMHLEPLKPIWIPVNTLGAQNPEYVRLFEDGFASNLPILMFPAGICSRVVEGKIADLQWKNTFVRRAHATGRQVVPLHVEGSLHKGFYRIYRWRKALGIKANIEMLYLVDGMFRQQGKSFRMSVGEPLTSEQLKGYGSIKEQVEEVRKKTYSMQKCDTK
ncbi:MAG: acyltransferase [Rikenellaceae bacterium]